MLLKWLAFALLHLLPLLLAATHFSLLKTPLDAGTWTFSFFNLSYRNGFGAPYVSDYSVPQILAYLVAYAAGLCFYPFVARPKFLAPVAFLLCLAGLVSFGLELSHRVLDHHLSLIASFPFPLALIALCSFVVTVWGRKQQPGSRPLPLHS